MRESPSSRDTVEYLVFLNSDSNLSYIKSFGGIYQFFNNQIFYANLMKDGRLFRKICQISGDYKLNAKVVYDAMCLLTDFL